MNSSSLSSDRTETPRTPAPAASVSSIKGPGPTATTKPSAIGAPPARKPQSKSRLDGLSPELQAQLEVWLLDQNRSYDEVCGLLAKEHGVATTKSSLSRYYQRWLVPKRQARALCDGRRLGPRAAEDGEVAALARARQLALAALMQPEPDLTTAQRLLEMVTALEQTRLAQLRVKLGLRR